jgi:hypothetical protein
MLRYEESGHQPLALDYGVKAVTQAGIDAETEAACRRSAFTLLTKYIVF